MTQKIHVAVGIICNHEGRYLISKRHTHLHQGGLWEFPGGKVEVGETVYSALCREFSEELNIVVKYAEPLIKISHHYSAKDVLLDVWRITDYNGVVTSQLQQPIDWPLLSELDNYTFPDANQAILSALKLPSYYAITGAFIDNADYFQKLERCLKDGIQLIQLRYKGSESSILDNLIVKSQLLCSSFGAKLIVNGRTELVTQYNIDGVHLNSTRLHEYSERPITKDKFLGVSVHTKEDLQQAIKIKADFAVVSPVLKTLSHPDANPIGWEGLASLISNSSIPIYALGGMKKELLTEVKKYGAFGIAAISDFWNKV